MNKNILKGKWNEMKGETKKKWGKLTDDKKMVISGHKEKLVGAQQTKYGYSKDRVEKEYRLFLEKHK